MHIHVYLPQFNKPSQLPMASNCLGPPHSSNCGVVARPGRLLGCLSITRHSQRIRGLTWNTWTQLPNTEKQESVFATFLRKVLVEMTTTLDFTHPSSQPAISTPGPGLSWTVKPLTSLPGTGFWNSVPPPASYFLDANIILLFTVKKYVT